MKKLKLLLLLLMLGGATAYSQLQQIKIVSFTVKNQLPAVIDSWGNIPASLLLVAQLPPTVRVKGIRLMVQIKGGGAIICSNNASGGLQVDEFTTRTFSANELTGSLQVCNNFKDGSYSICVQFFNVDRVAISNEVCKEFMVETPKEIEYAPPTLITPENGKTYTEAELSRPVNFRWTPLVPKPREAVTYRLKVWQLMQGQNGTTAIRTNQPIITKDVDNITQAVVNGIYTGPCKPPYLCDYIWQVQALNKEDKPMGRNQGNSEPYTFKVAEKETVPNKYAAPKLVWPENGKKFSPKDMAGPLTLRWMPVAPKPQEPVTYRLKVWQLMQGQNAASAMKENKPLVETEYKDILIDMKDQSLKAVVNNIYNGPCKPPYLCDYVWQVQAVNKEGQPVGSNDGKSEAWSFKVLNNIDIQIDSVKVGCCEKGVQTIYIKVKNNLATSVNIVAVKYKINGVGAAINLMPISPTLPKLVAGNGTVVFTSTIECNANINFLKFLVDAEDVADPDNKETEVKSDTLNCICNACKEIKIQPNEKDKPTITATGITQDISFVTGPGKVKSVKMDLVWFEFVPESDDCLVCTTPSAQMGNFSAGSINAVAASGGGTHGLSWNFSPPKDMNGGAPLQYTISYPKMVACCAAKAKWCIRYTVTYENCVTCSVVVCNYEAAIKGCNK